MTNWRNNERQNGPPRGRENGGRGGPIRFNPRFQPARGPQYRPPTPTPQKSYDKPKPIMRQNNMPYFTTVEGKFTKLCVYTAQEQACPNPECEKSHEPKRRRICPMFHNSKERCPHNPCLLGHDKAGDALKASKAFGKCERLAKQQETLLQVNDQKPTAKTPPVQNPDEQTIIAPTNTNPKPQPAKQTETEGGTQNVPPVEI
jgi:hypothetical protein